MRNGASVERIGATASRFEEPRGEAMVVPEEVAAMLRLHGLGWGSKRIAKELDVSRGTVKRYVAAGGWQPFRPPARTKLLDGEDAWLSERLRQHRGNADVVRQELAALGNPPKDGEPPPAPPAGLTPKTAERYRELAEGQIIPHLGDIALQRLRPAKIEEWHAALLKGGSRKGKPLSGQTVAHAHRILHRALKRAAKTEIVSRNVAAVVSPPKATRKKVRILTADEITDTLARFKGHALYALAALDLATGLRRGELVGLRLTDLDLDTGTVCVCRAVEETAAGLRVKKPKTEKGWRTLSLPPSTIAVMREHRRELLGTRLKVGLGKPDADTPVFGEPDGSILRPNRLSCLWRAAVKSLGATRVNLHALRHTYASALIAAGLDVITVQHKTAHGSATTTPQHLRPSFPQG